MIDKLESSETISQDECRRRIGNAHQQRIRNCYRIAFDRYNKMPPEDRKDMTSRARANVIHDFAAIQATKEFSGITGVEVVDNRESNGYFLLIFDDDLVLRLKKFKDDTFRTSSIVTANQQQFALQQSPLPGIGATTNLIAGYLLDEFETKIDVIAIVCSLDDRTLWAWDITTRDVERSDVDISEQFEGVPQPRIRSSESATRLRSPLVSEEENSKTDSDENTPN